MSRERLRGVLLGGEPEAAAVAAPAFVACPVALQGWAGACPWQAVYERAYAQAVAVMRPSIVERLQRDLTN
jgi:hypothetical protein